jgi:hypothetical protein
MFPRYGFTFEYRVSKPDIPVKIEITRSDRSNHDGYCQLCVTGTVKLRGHEGRYCYSNSYDRDHDIDHTGVYLFRVFIDGTLAKEWTINQYNK